MKTWNEQQPGEEEGSGGAMVGQVMNKKKEDDKPKFEGQGFALGGPQQKSSEPQMTPEEIALMNEFKDDPEMFQAMLASMREAQLDAIVIVPEPTASDDPANVCTIQFKGTQKVIRKFLKNQTTI